MAASLRCHNHNWYARSSFLGHAGCPALRNIPLRCSNSRLRPAAASQSASSDAPPPGCSRYTVSIKKPLGIVLEQNKDTGSIVVVEVRPESSADKTGLIRVGDQLVATSGVTYTKTADYNDVSVKMGQEVVRLLVQGESFKTVSAAIGSHPGHMPVTLEFQRCE